jgi:hypothetical protein
MNMDTFPDEDDPIAEVRRHRKEIFSRFGGDRKLIYEDIERTFADWPAKRVSFCPEYPVGWNSKKPEEGK